MRKAIRAAVNREVTAAEIIGQLSDLNNTQLIMVADYIKGLKAAEKYLGQG